MKWVHYALRKCNTDEHASVNWFAPKNPPKIKYDDHL